MNDVPVFADEPYQSHPGPDVVESFMRQILDLDGRCMDYLFDYQRLVMTLNDERNFAWAFECYIYHGRFNKDNVRHHDHLTGNYVGAAHERCNLLLRKTYARLLPQIPRLRLAPDGVAAPLIPWARQQPHRPGN